MICFVAKYNIFMLISYLRIALRLQFVSRPIRDVSVSYRTNIAKIIKYDNITKKIAMPIGGIATESEG